MAMPKILAVRGLRKLHARFRRMEAETKRQILAATREVGIWLHQHLPPYAPRPAHSRYKRTGTLGKTMFTKAEWIGSAAVGLIGSPVEYAPYVISTEPVGSRGPQTVFHKMAGWWTLQGEVKRRKGDIVRIYRKALKRIKNA